MKRFNSWIRNASSVAVLAAVLGLAAWVGCMGCNNSASTITIDGSSTVYPISEAVAEEFPAVNRNVKVTASYSGTGGGFKRFAAGETEISDASRPIKDSEAETCKQNGVEFVQFTVGIDGLAVLVNPENTWCDCLTVDQLKELWRPESAVKKWSDLNKQWPDEPINLYGPGYDSGTFDYFTEVIVGESKSSRSDYTKSEDDNALVRGIEGDKNALGYFGYAYYEENKGKLKLLGVDGGEGCIKPDPETVRTNTYKPLSRPLFIYVSKNALQRPEVLQFVEFYLENAPELAADVGYVPIPQEIIDENQKRLTEASGG